MCIYCILIVSIDTGCNPGEWREDTV